MIAITRKFLILFALTAVAAGLTACAEEEQNRVLSYKKGTYLGTVSYTHLTLPTKA